VPVLRLVRAWRGGEGAGSMVRSVCGGHAVRDAASFASLLRAGQTTILCEGGARSESGELVAKAVGTFWARNLK
jgi:hypothetical protein